MQFLLSKGIYIWWYREVNFFLSSTWKIIVSPNQDPVYRAHFKLLPSFLCQVFIVVYDHSSNFRRTWRKKDIREKCVIASKRRSVCSSPKTVSLKRKIAETPWYVCMHLYGSFDDLDFRCWGTQPKRLLPQ
jgi:hypothetical protein